MRPGLLIAIVLAVVAAAPAEAWKTTRCKPPAETLLGRTAGGTVAYTDFGDVFACRRGGRAIRIGSDESYGPTQIRLAGGFAALATEACDKYDGWCVTTNVSVWNLRRYDRVAHRKFSIADGDDVHGSVLDMELCASGGLAVLLQVSANRELWTQRRDRWSRRVAEPDVDAGLERVGDVAWLTRGGRRHVGVSFCAR